MPAKKKSAIGRLFATLASGKFTPETYLRVKRLVSYADEDNELCKRCTKKNAVGGCGLCYHCATDTLINLIGLTKMDAVLGAQAKENEAYRAYAE